MHDKRKMKTFKAFKKRNTQYLMKQLKESNFAKNGNFAHEEHGVFPSQVVTWRFWPWWEPSFKLSWVTKRWNEISLPKVKVAFFEGEEEDKEDSSFGDSGGGFGLKKVRALEFLWKWGL